MRRRELLIIGAVIAVAGATGCLDRDDGKAPTGPGPSGLAPDFALGDVNPSSPSFGTMVSPRNFQDQVSAWYFGYAT